ncbi:MAG: response regulator [Cyclobacteriaceae bacterium]|nr:response regulator [Cyclobacteriaceae bacterium]
MITSIVIDDEPLARSLVREYLQSFPEIQVLQECGDGFEAVKAINSLKPDLIFLDIQMPRISGFEMLELLEHTPAIIFTTAFEEHAVKAFEKNAIDYLLKPFSKERFRRAVEHAKDRLSRKEPLMTQEDLSSRLPSASDRIVVRAGTDIVIIPANNIHYMEACDDYVKVHTAQGYYMKKKTLSYYESVLDPSLFLRVHRSYILNLSELTRIEAFDKENHLALLRTGARIPLSRSGYQKLKEVLGA